MNTGISYEYLLTYQNFDNRDVALTYCSKYLKILDKCLVINVQNIGHAAIDNINASLSSSSPFITINKWSHAKPVKQGWDENQIKKKREECKVWWTTLKTDLRSYHINKHNLKQ